MNGSVEHPQAALQGPATSTAGEICRALTKASRSNFTYAFLFLPRARREALYAIYAFCRVTDDLVDEAGTSPETDPPVLERLAAWRAELLACTRGAATHPVIFPVMRRLIIGFADDRTFDRLNQHGFWHLPSSLSCMKTHNELFPVLHEVRLCSIMLQHTLYNLSWHTHSHMLKISVIAHDILNELIACRPTANSHPFGCNSIG